MMRSAAALLLIAVGLQGAAAQQAGSDDKLNETQKHGRQVFAQSCGVCHLPPAMNALSAAELRRIRMRLSHCEMTFSCTFCGRWVATSM